MVTPVGEIGTGRGHDRRWWALAVLCLGLAVVTMDMTILNLALPSIAGDLRPTAVETLWIVDVYSLALAGFLVPTSTLAERWGRRRMLVAGFVVFGAGSLGVLLATGPLAVIGLRALLGIGGAMILPTTLSMIRTLFLDPKERATALGLWGAVTATSAALGPIVGGGLLEFFSWHSAFLLNVPVMVGAVFGALALLPEGRSSNPPGLDLIANILAMAGMLALVYGIKQFADEGGTAEVAVAAVIAAVTLPLFVVRCLRAKDPVLEVRLFRDKVFTSGALVVFFSSIGLVASLLLISQWLQLVQGWSPIVSGVALLPIAMGGMIGGPLASTLAARFGTRTVLAGGMLLSGLGFLVLALPVTMNLATVLAAQLLIGSGTTSFVLASAVIMLRTPAAKAGSAAATEQISYEIGGVIGIAFLGSIASAAYRSGLSTSTLTGIGLTPHGADAARDSLAGALGESTQLAGQAGERLETLATASFTDSLATVGAVGAVLLIAAATLVHRLVPREFDVTAHDHP
ncbi:MFS transporter [Streptomyces acidicola]|uniref:MFS transporter n=1 Tax=Streptomyces acidicola TaxID=2596892 RepID=UPI00343F6B77